MMQHIDTMSKTQCQILMYSFAAGSPRAFSQLLCTSVLLFIRLEVYSQSTQNAGPVRFLIFCSIRISLLASLVAGRRPQCSVGAD
jgi:hypothetical protein